MKELIEQKAMLLATCKLTKEQIEAELHELISSINSDAPSESPNVRTNESKEKFCCATCAHDFDIEHCPMCDDDYSEWEAK